MIVTKHGFELAPRGGAGSREETLKDGCRDKRV